MFKQRFFGFKYLHLNYYGWAPVSKNRYWSFIRQYRHRNLCGNRFLGWFQYKNSFALIKAAKINILNSIFFYVYVCLYQLLPLKNFDFVFLSLCMFICLLFNGKIKAMLHIWLAITIFEIKMIWKIVRSCWYCFSDFT